MGTGRVELTALIEAPLELAWSLARDERSWPPGPWTRTYEEDTHTVLAERPELRLRCVFRREGGGVRARWAVEPADSDLPQVRRWLTAFARRAEQVAGHRDTGPAGEPVRVLLSLDVRPGRQAEFEALWSEHAARVATDPGNLGQSLAKRTDSDTGYVVLTDWVDEPAFRRFEHSPRQREYLERLWPMRAGGTMALLRTVRAVDGPHTAKKGTH